MGKGFLFLLLGVFVISIDAGVIDSLSATSDSDDCSSGDALACVQLRVFRSMKSFFDQNRVDLIGGLSIIKDKGGENGRSAKSLEVGETFDVSDDFEKRQTALESYAIDNVMKFMQGRALRFDPSTMVDTVTATVRSLADRMPAGVQKFVTQLMTEGRGRKKKLQQLLPLLVGIKMKLGTVIILAALGIALLAKKAILASFISLAISIYIIVKKFLAHHHHHHPHHHGHHEAHHIPWAAAPVFGGAYHSPAHTVASYGGGSSGGWDAATSYGVGDDTFGSHSSPVAHKIAFGGQKPKRR